MWHLVLINKRFWVLDNWSNEPLARSSNCVDQSRRQTKPPPRTNFLFTKCPPTKISSWRKYNFFLFRKYKHSLVKKYNFVWCYGQQTQFQEEMWFTWEMRNLSNLICQRRETWIGLTFGCMRTSYMWSLSSDIAKFHEYFKWHFSHFAFPFMKPLTFAFMKLQRKLYIGIFLFRFWTGGGELRNTPV